MKRDISSKTKRTKSASSFFSGASDQTTLISSRMLVNNSVLNQTNNAHNNASHFNNHSAFTINLNLSNSKDSSAFSKKMLVPSKVKPNRKSQVPMAVLMGKVNKEADKKKKSFAQDINSEGDELEQTTLQIPSPSSKKEYYNKLSLERINFRFDEYKTCTDEILQPSVLFFKYLAIKPDLEQEYLAIGKPIKRLKLFVPDTIVINDNENNYWVYTDEEGNVRRTFFSDGDVIDKFRSQVGDDNEVLAIFKSPVSKSGCAEENQVEVLNLELLERHLLTKNSSSPYVIQRFVKCRGPKAFICRSIYRKNKPPYVYILTNNIGYNDLVLTENNQGKFITNTQRLDSFNVFYASSGKHLQETHKFMTDIVKFIEFHSGIIFEELVGDFIKDEAGIWWFINLKAMKVSNAKAIMDNTVNLEYFTNRSRQTTLGRSNSLNVMSYPLMKCKFCGLEYRTNLLKHKLSTKMILETDKMLKHVGMDINVIDRPDLKHTDSSMLYLPHRVCEDCYLLFETMHEIKTYQVEIANNFGNPVNLVNFGVNCYIKENEDHNLLGNDLKLTAKHLRRGSSPIIHKDIDHRGWGTFQVMNTSGKEYSLFRMLFMFSDFFWNESVPVPTEELYLVFNFVGKNYKVKLGKHFQSLDYFEVDFMKIFYIITDENYGFIEYFEKNKQMYIKLGYFKEENVNENNEKTMRELKKKAKITFEDKDECFNIDKFVEFASVELSVQALKCGQKFRNILNALLFKKSKPHYVGKIKITIRINKEKSDDIFKLNLSKYCNFYLPMVHYVIPDELPLYWLEMVEKQKVRLSILEKIVQYIERNNIALNSAKKKENAFRLLELSLNTFQDTYKFK